MMWTRTCKQVVELLTGAPGSSTDTSGHVGDRPRQGQWKLSGQTNVTESKRKEEVRQKERSKTTKTEREKEMEDILVGECKVRKGCCPRVREDQISERVNTAPNTRGARGSHPQSILDLEEEAQHEDKEQHWQEHQSKFETQVSGVSGQRARRRRRAE